MVEIKLLDGTSSLLENGGESSQYLQVLIGPDGSFQIELAATEEPVAKSTLLLQAEISRCFHADAKSWLLFLGFCDSKVILSPSLSYWRNFSYLFTRKLSLTPDLENLRHKIKIEITNEELEQFVNGAPLIAGSEYLNRELLAGLWSNLNDAFASAIKDYTGHVEDFIKTYSPNVHLLGRVFFHLVEKKDEQEPFAFLATYSTQLNKQGKSKHLPLKAALQEYGSNSKKLLELLATVQLAAKESMFITELLESGELFHPLSWSAREAFGFLKEIPLYEKSGILCRIPNWWQGNTARLRLNITIGDSQTSFVGMEALLDFNAQLMIWDTPITEEEVSKLLNATEGLAFIKNKWVAVDPEKLKQTLDAYQQAKKIMQQTGLNLKDALRMQLNPEKFLGDHAQEADLTVSNGTWLASVLEKLRNPELTPKIKPAMGFKAELREYQKKGLNWLYFLHTLGFGACLADDMGLGKTIQLLAFLSALKAKSTRKASLLVLPASLIGNWTAEIERFYPGLCYYVAHPAMHAGKQVETLKETDLNKLELVITTYAMAQKYEWLHSYVWEYIILDEAQAIKNPASKQTRQIKKYQARSRIVMTGTPIENRTGDLWSLFDFLNPGLLGTSTEFSRYTSELRANPDGYARLRKLIKPYILRRLKTDKSIISDLPEKVEMKTYSSLSKKQIILYRQLVGQLAESLQTTEGIQRKGLVLSALMKFKQICNHPDQYLGSGEFAELDSGKFTRLRDICEVIYEKREKVLVFTQFKEMTEPISWFLEGIFKKKGLVLHGSIPVGKRKELIDQFQSQDYIPFMVLSLKAGGVGLNLTQANHVIHFDRWWNPAVENQATDRVFRIGQKKNVLVHKFITQGTIEEKIDQMLEDKSRLSREIVADSGESWLTEMNNRELLDIFQLNLSS